MRFLFVSIARGAVGDRVYIDLVTIPRYIALTSTSNYITVDAVNTGMAPSIAVDTA